jgi:hypothetical protein
MRIHNLYEDEHGEFHWRDIEVEWTGQTPGGPRSDRLPATGVIFRQMPTSYDLDWHPAPRRQYVVKFDGVFQITASDGEVRVIGADGIVLVEDVAGKGHLSKDVAGRPYHTLFVVFDQPGQQNSPGSLRPPGCLGHSAIVAVTVAPFT